MFVTHATWFVFLSKTTEDFVRNDIPHHCDIERFKARNIFEL